MGAPPRRATTGRWPCTRPVDRSEAEALFRRGLANSSANGAGTDVSPMLMLNYARTFTRLGHLEQASMWAKRADGLARSAGDQVILDQSLMLRASLARRLGRTTEADRLLDQAQRRFASLFPPGSMACRVSTADCDLPVARRGCDATAARRPAAANIRRPACRLFP
jgi:hypothetical protein